MAVPSTAKTLLSSIFNVHNMINWSASVLTQPSAIDASVYILETSYTCIAIKLNVKIYTGIYIPSHRTRICHIMLC